MDTYREQRTHYPLALPGDTRPLHPGPRFKCPACKAPPPGEFSAEPGVPYSSYYGVKTPEKCMANWFTRLFGGCREKRRHFHQHCSKCGSKWVVGWAEEDQYLP